MKSLIGKIASPIMLVGFFVLVGCAEQNHMSHKSMEKSNMEGEMKKEMGMEEKKSTPEMKKGMMNDTGDAMEEKTGDGINTMAKDMDESMSGNKKKME